MKLSAESNFFVDPYFAMKKLFTQISSYATLIYGYLCHINGIPLQLDMNIGERKKNNVS